MPDCPLDVSVIIVSWNVRDLLAECLRSVERALAMSDFRGEVIVVDNASQDGTLQMVKGEFPNVRILPNEANLGFTRANNQGIALARGRYLLLLNPDTQIAADAIATLVAYADSHADVGVIGPRLTFPDGSVQSSRRRFPTLLTGCIESTVFQRLLPHHPVLQEYYVLDQPDDQVQEVDWVVGACMLLRRAAIDQVGAFDQRFFMYSEELDLCFRMKRAGWKVVYLPHAGVVHHEAKSSEQNQLGRNIHFHDSKCKFFGKHFGAHQELILRCVVLIHFALLIIEDVLKLLLLARNRSMRKARIEMLSKAAGWHLLHVIPEGRR